MKNNILYVLVHITYFNVAVRNVINIFGIDGGELPNWGVTKIKCGIAGKAYKIGCYEVVN